MTGPKWAALGLAGAVLSGCEGLDSAGGGGAFDIDQYFEGTASWTFRDDGDTGDVDDSQVLRGQLDEDGTMEVRRGTRYAEGEKVGSFRWDLTATDLVLSGWSWGSEGSDTATFFARGGAHSGDSVGNLQGDCVAESVADVSTHYGTFDHALASTCVDTPAPSGTWWFAPGFGLVRLESDIVTLDLVAPY